MLARIGTIITTAKGLIELARLVWAAIERIRRDVQIRRDQQAIEEAMRTRDQTKLEEQIGSDNAGKPTDERIEGIRTRPVRDRSSVP